MSDKGLAVGAVLQKFRDGDLSNEEARKRLGELLNKDPERLVLETDGDSVDLSELVDPEDVRPP